MPTPIVIVGGGGHAAEVCSYLASHPDFALIGVLDDAKPPGSFEQTRLLGPIERLGELACSEQGLHFITAFGDNELRLSVMRRIEGLPVRIPPAVVVAPLAHVGPNVELGEGTLLAPGAVLTTKVKIGRHCIVNVNVSVSHDCQISDFVNLNPGATVCGSVCIGEGAYIGAGATIIDKVSVGAWSVIGAGSGVIRDVPARVTVVGVPAKTIRNH